MDHIDSPNWIKNKKSTNPINKKDNGYFQYAVTVVLNREEIKKDLQRITKVKSFINKYNWEGINFLSEKDDWKKIGKNSVTVTINVLYAKKEKNIYPANVSKQNSNQKTGYSFNDSKRRRMALPCSQKTISVIERNNF